MSDVETSVRPPESDSDEGGSDQSSRLTVSLIRVDDVNLDAAVQLFGDDAADPEKLAEGILNAALALAQLAGPDVAWATMHRFASYEGGAS